MPVIASLHCVCIVTSRTPPHTAAAVFSQLSRWCWSIRAQSAPDCSPLLGAGHGAAVELGLVAESELAQWNFILAVVVLLEMDDAPSK